MEQDELYIECREDPQFDSEFVIGRRLRGPQCEMIKRVEAHVEAHAGGVMTILSSRQTGKNQIAAELQRRHLWVNQNSKEISSWIRTAPTYIPQIVNSKKRLRELLDTDSKYTIRHPLFNRAKLIREEGYIWRVGNATV